MTSAGPLESDTCRDYVIPKLEAAGWKDRFIEQYPITDGRIIPKGRKYRRGKPLRADYVLEFEPNLPIAVVEAKRLFKIPGQGLQQAMNYAQLLDLPLAYSTNGQGVVEHDYDTGVERNLTGFPEPDELWQRYRAWKGLTEPMADVVRFPFDRTLRNPDGSVKEPRYYQRVAIHRALQAVLEAKDECCSRWPPAPGRPSSPYRSCGSCGRAMAGRPQAAVPLSGRSQHPRRPADPARVPAGLRRRHLEGRRRSQDGREIYFALYQALADSGDNLGIFRDYPEDFFDLVVVDECHRGSARDESTWRGILDHFAPATQLGMTATPKRDDNVDTYAYFGDPLYTYSLKEGIEDGFLAPYRVRRVVLSPDAYGWGPDEGQLDMFGREIPPGLYTTQEFERVVSLLTRTQAAAHHLTEYLKKTDRMAKTIVFCVDQEHAEQMRAAMQKENQDLTRQFPDYVARIVSAEGDVGEELLGRFADPESEEPVIATTSRLLSTGVDMPTVKNIVLFKPIGSIVDFKQIIGRGTRIYEDVDKLSFEIIDYSGATALFEDPEFDGPPERPHHRGGGRWRPRSKTRPKSPNRSPSTRPKRPREVDAEDIEHRARKHYVDDSEVFVAAEGFYLPDPTTGSLRLVEYADYVADQVRHLFPRPATFGQVGTIGPAAATSTRPSPREDRLRGDRGATRLTDADPRRPRPRGMERPDTSRSTAPTACDASMQTSSGDVAPEAARARGATRQVRGPRHNPTRRPARARRAAPSRVPRDRDRDRRDFGGKRPLHETIDELYELLYTA